MARSVYEDNRAFCTIVFPSEVGKPKRLSIPNHSFGVEDSTPCMVVRSVDRYVRVSAPAASFSSSGATLVVMTMK